MNMSSDIDRRKQGCSSKSSIISAMALAIICLGNGPGLANPLGPQVVNGQVSFAQQGNTLAITNSPNSIINWQSFSINPGEITRFIQQNPNSSVLNRIVGQDPSQILGALQSNGRVFLINPNGVIFGQGARVDVNGLVASTLNLSNQDFLTGRLNFTAGDKAANIQNQGAITTPSGGQVYLIASNVENSGIIASPSGDVVLAAGHTVKLVDSANPDLHVVLSAGESRAINVGQIIAQGGKIGIYGALINQRGLVNANSVVVGENGKIVFRASRDTLLEAGSRTSATGAGKGGDIRILGERIALTGDAMVDVSGQTGGGTVLVGGDYQGRNPDIQNAQQTYVSADAQIAANAVQSGDGGKVIVWSDEVTRVFGSISARGGALSGNGGFVETSGHHLDMQGSVDTRAPNGATGTLLLDPTNIYIALNQASATAAGMSGTDSTASTGSSPFVASGIVSDSLLSTATLQAALAASSVVVSTTNDSGSSAGVITVVDPVTWGSSSNLSLNASNDILINAAINGAAGSVTLNAPTGAIFGSGTITAASLTAVAWGGIGGPLLTQVAALNVTNTGSDTNVNIRNTGALTVQSVTQTFSGGVGSIIVNNNGPLTINGPVTSGAGNITLEAGTSGSAADQLTVTGSGSVSCGSGNILLRAGGAINLVGTVNSASGTVTLQANLNPSAPVLAQAAALQATINLINAVNESGYITTPLPLTYVVSIISPPLAARGSSSTASGSSSTASGSSSAASEPAPVAPADKKQDDTKADDKKDEKKDEKKDTNIATKDGSADKKDAAKKMYCN
jgi:filamentous hemagglutinin family protein